MPASLVAAFRVSIIWLSSLIRHSDFVIRHSLHYIPHPHPQRFHGRAVADGDLQQSAAADQRQWLAGGNVPVGALQLTEVDAVPAEARHAQRLERLQADVGGGVAKGVDMDDADWIGGIAGGFDV